MLTVITAKEICSLDLIKKILAGKYVSKMF
jgi:hypothetical protein